MAGILWISKAVADDKYCFIDVSIKGPGYVMTHKFFQILLSTQS